jgi:alkanesulfonate monooxygenase SsuD/methylene tetrahydromethanopterin reductase-like flavin-dependent oxidoreductase (luciferase family)
VHIGMAVPQSWDVPAKSLGELKEFIRAAEDGGIDSLWVQEQLIGRDPSFEPLSTLAFVAAITHRVRLAAAGFVAPLRPALGLAKALASIDQFSLGRLEAGFVLGEMPSAYAAGNVDWATRAHRFEDAITVIRSLWRDPVTNHASAFGVYQDVAITPKPVQPNGPPVWIGAKAGTALDRVARLADGWMGAGGSSIADWRNSLESLREACQKHGRPALRVGKKVYLWIDDDSDLALDRLGHWFTTHWGAADGRDMARRLGVWGSAERVADVLAEIVEIGADTIVLNPVGDERRQLEIICDSIIPQFR